MSLIMGEEIDKRHILAKLKDDYTRCVMGISNGTGDTNLYRCLESNGYGKMGAFCMRHAQYRGEINETR